MEFVKRPLAHRNVMKKNPAKPSIPKNPTLERLKAAVRNARRAISSPI
jgi:hypothetical protein